MGSTAVKHTVCRLSVESFLRNQTSLRNGIAMLRGTNAINVFNPIEQDCTIVLPWWINFVSSRVAFAWHACTECFLWSPSFLVASSTSSLQGFRDETWVSAFSIQLLHNLLEGNLDVVRFLSFCWRCCSNCRQ